MGMINCCDQLISVFQKYARNLHEKMKKIKGKETETETKTESGVDKLAMDV